MLKMTIGDLARNAGVGVETVRFYQRRGLLDEPARKAGSHRLYSQDTLRQLRFIRRCAGLGFPLKEIGRLIRLRKARKGTCAEIRACVAQTSEAIDVKLRGLETKQRLLKEMLGSCAGHEPLESCLLCAALTDDS